MNINLVYSLVVFILLVPLAWVLRRSILIVSVLAISIFVVALPWIRWVLAGYLPDISKGGYFEQYSGLYLFSIGVFLVGVISPKLGYLRPRIIRQIKENKVASIYWKTSLLILVIVWIVRIFRASQYGILFSGTGDEQNIAHQSYIFVIFFSLMQVLGLGSIIYVGMSFNSHRYISIFLWICELTWALISEGRREFIFMVGLILFIRFVGSSRKRFRSIIIFLTLGYGFVEILTPLFLLSRDYVVMYSFSFDAFTSVVNGVGDAIKEFAKNRDTLSGVVTQNLADRGDAGQFMAAIAHAINYGFDFLYGKALISAFAWSVPSIVVAKPEYPVEQLIQVALGMPLRDDAVSWAAVGYADFGLYGCFFYGLIFAILINFCFIVSRFANNILISIAGAGQACRLSYNFEADPLMSFAAIRTLIIIVVVFNLYKILISKRKKVSIFR